MNKLLILFLSYFLPISCFAIENWQKKLDNITVPSYFNTALYVYFKYNTTVNGYTITGKLFPFDTHSETGNVILLFDNAQTHKSFVYSNPNGEVYTSNDITEIVFNKNFKGFSNGETYTFHYISPQNIKNRVSDYPTDALHPLGYYTPFQFHDIDFDGRKELLINDWSRDKGGNTYQAYELKNDKLVPIKTAPIENISNSDEINSKDKSITIISEDGVFEYIEFHYILKGGKADSRTYPKFESWMSESQIKLPINSRFTLKSVYEKVNGKEFRYEF